MISSTTNGAFAIAPTPLLADGTVDEPSIDQMVTFHEEGCGGSRAASGGGCLLARG